MNRSDELPKCVCAVCWEKTNEFNEFYRSVHIAQEEYLKQVVKLEVENETENHCIEQPTEQPKFVEVITNCDEFNEFSDENVFKPNNALDDTDQHEIKHIELTDEFQNELTDAFQNELAVVEKVERIEANEEEIGEIINISPI